jgi:hypothetical protein
MGGDRAAFVVWILVQRYCKFKARTVPAWRERRAGQLVWILWYSRMAHSRRLGRSRGVQTSSSRPRP